jgi:hypothetical protein
LRGSGSLLLVHLLRGASLLSLLRRASLLRLLRGPRLLRLWRLFRFALVIALLIVLGNGNGCSSEEQRQNRYADHAGLFHLGSSF